MFEVESFLRNGLVALAMKDVDVVLETQGNNRSPAIDQRNIWMGGTGLLGAPYCLTGQQYNLHMFCKKYGLINPVYKTPGTQDFIHHASVLKYCRPAGELGKKGDWASFVHSNPNQGHETMLREDQAAYPYFNTVEYNTNNAGSRDGDGTWTHTRSEIPDGSLRFQKFVNVVQWVMDANPGFKLPSLAA